MRNAAWLVTWLCSLPGRKCHHTAEGVGDKRQFRTPLLHPTGDEEAQNAADDAAVKMSAAGKKNDKLVANERGVRLAFTSHV